MENDEETATIILHAIYLNQAVVFGYDEKVSHKEADREDRDAMGEGREKLSTGTSSVSGVSPGVSNKVN